MDGQLRWFCGEEAVDFLKIYELAIGGSEVGGERRSFQRAVDDLIR